MDGSEEPPLSNADPKVLKDYQKLIKKICPSSASTWRTTKLQSSRVAKDPERCGKLFTTFTRRRVCQHLLYSMQIFYLQMKKDDDLLDHINKIKALTNQLVCLEVHVTDEDIVITLFESLPTSYKYLIPLWK